MIYTFISVVGSILKDLSLPLPIRNSCEDRFGTNDLPHVMPHTVQRKPQTYYTSM